MRVRVVLLSRRETDMQARRVTNERRTVFFLMVKSYDDVCVSFFGETIPIRKMGRANMRKNNELVSPKANDEGFSLQMKLVKFHVLFLV